MMSLNHVHLRVKSVSLLCDFYQKYFSMQILDRNDVEIYLGNVKGSWLTLSQAAAGDEALPSWFHFGFCLSSKEEVRALFNAMKADGLHFPRELTEFGDDALTFYVLDPEGHKIEVSWIRVHQG